MTSKQIYEATAIELSKVQAPTLKLYEFNYFFNQAIRQFVNKVYNIYDVNQQTTDDLRVLKATATLLPKPMADTKNPAIDYLHRGTYFVDMPDDYLHLLNCVCLFNVSKTKDCWNKGDVMVVGATKMTADSWSSIIDDVYNRPTKKHPYYYIHNQNNISVDSNNELTATNNVLPTNPKTDGLHTYTKDAWRNVLDAARLANTAANADKNSVINAAISAAGDNLKMKTAISNISNDTNIITASQTYEALCNSFVITGNSNFSRTFDFTGVDEKLSTVEKPAGARHANSSTVRVEIRCGRDNSNIFDLAAIQIDYVKAPQFIRLTQEELDSDEDISQVMEFPDYVNQEIINELVNLVMRKTNDPSLQTHLLMTQSIARPTGQLTQQPAS